MRSAIDAERPTGVDASAESADVLSVERPRDNRATTDASHTVRHQIFLRRSRGGSGIPFAAARDELRAVFSAEAMHVISEDPRTGRVDVRFSIDDDALRALAPRLGYIEAIVRATPFAAEGRPLARRRGRWTTGFVRAAHIELLLEEVFVAPPLEVLAPAGHTGLPARRRRLSSADARFLANIVGLHDGARVLDPFAGRGTLTKAMVARGLRVTGADLSPCAVREARIHAQGACWLVADAAALPFGDAVFDGVVTEPPYLARELDVVARALVEMIRVTRREGRIAALLSEALAAHVAPVGADAQLDEVARYPLSRHGRSVSVHVWRRA